MKRRDVLTALAWASAVFLIGIYFYTKPVPAMETSLSLLPPSSSLPVPPTQINEQPISNDRNTNISWFDRLTTNILSEINTTDWKIYRSDTYGFEVAHPRDWIISEEGYNTNELPTMLDLTFMSPVTDELVLTVATSSALRTETKDGGPEILKETITLNGMRWTGLDLRRDGVMLNLEAEHKGLFYNFWDTFFTQDYAVAVAVIKSFKFTR